MTVQCPYCETAYALPERLLGKRGARVRCRVCKRGFVVSRAMRHDPREGAEARAVARELLDSLAQNLGPALDEARGRGRLLATFGPDLVSAFDRYRARLGRRGDPDAFREALREAWGVDLTPPADS